MPEISVLIPYYNDRKFLKQAIQSVLNQTFKDFELILINHATQDDCRKIAHSFDDKRIIHVDFEFNNGAGGGIILEKFLEHASGKYIKLFCADDMMKEDCLEKLRAYLVANEDKDIVFGDANLVDKDGASMNLLWSKKFWDFDFKDSNLSLLKKYFQKKTFLPLPASLFKRSVLNGLTLDKSLIVEFDQTLWIQMLLSGVNFGFTKDIVCDYRVHEGQCSTIRKFNRIDNYDFYESIVRAKLFFGIKNRDQLTYILDGYDKKLKITDSDVDYFGFAVACYYLEKQDMFSCRIAGYEYLHDCMDNPKIRQDLHKKFGFTLADFRRIYKSLEAYDPALNLGEFGIRTTIDLVFRKIIAKYFGDGKDKCSLITDRR